MELDKGRAGLKERRTKYQLRPPATNRTREDTPCLPMFKGHL